MRVRVFRPPGLAPGFVALLDESVCKVPYYFCNRTGEVRWDMPLREKQCDEVVETSATGTATNDREKLTRILNRDNTLEARNHASSDIRDKGAGDSTRGNNSRESEQSKRIQRSQREHPVTVARRKLDDGVISYAEYEHIRRTNAELEGIGRSIVKDGYLLKRGRRTGIWVQRWFQITTDLAFSCSKNESSVDTPSSVFDLSSVLCMPENINGRHAIHIQDLHTEDEIMVAAANLEDQICWLEAILRVKTEKAGGDI